MTDQPRDPTGRFVYTLESAQRDGQAALMRARNKTYRQIARELGYASPSHAHEGVARALATAVREPASEALALMLEQLGVLYQEADRILQTPHPVVQNGKVVMIEHPETGRRSAIPDPRPVLDAIETCLKIIDQHARLLGLYHPKRVDIFDRAELDEAIRRLEDEIKLPGNGESPTRACTCGAVRPPDVRLAVGPSGVGGRDGVGG